MQQKVKGEVFLILATIIWGSAFIFQKMGMDHIGPMTFTAFRFGIGTICMIPVILISDSIHRKKKLNQYVNCGSGKCPKSNVTTLWTKRALVVGGILVGLANFAAFIIAQIPEMREESDRSNHTCDFEIEGLHRIRAEECDKLRATLLDAFSYYPKLMKAYPKLKDRQIAIEMVINYYLAYDFKFGFAYSLDEEINEGIVIVHSDEMTYAEEKIAEANCENDRFKAAAARLTETQVEFWWRLFDELDRQERSLNIPKPHIYVDFLGVKQSSQGKGNGSRLIETLKAKADEIGLPIMLFTNGDENVDFYLSRGFRIIGVTKSEEFGFENVYMLYENA